MEYVNKQRRNVISLSDLDTVPRNSSPGGFAYIGQSKSVGIIAIKTERTQIRNRTSCPANSACTCTNDQQNQMTA